MLPAASSPPSWRRPSRPMFSRMAMNSISGVMMPWRAYCNCVTTWPGFGAQRAPRRAVDACPFRGRSRPSDSSTSPRRRIQSRRSGGRPCRGRCRETIRRPTGRCNHRPAPVRWLRSGRCGRRVGLRVISRKGTRRSGMKAAGQIDFFGIGQRVAAVRFERIIRGNHNKLSRRHGSPEAALPFASITWIRFNGSFASAKLSALRPSGTGSPHCKTLLRLRPGVKRGAEPDHSNS